MIKKPDIDKFETYFFDLDGTLYLGENPIEGASKLVQKLISMKKNVYAITNNPIKDNREYWQKLNNMNISIPLDHVINSTTTTIDWINQSKFSNKKVFVHGTQSMKNQMQRAKLNITSNLHEADLIVIGNDLECTWRSLTDVAIKVQKGTPFIASNSDLRLPLAGKVFAVDTGTTANLIRDVANVEPLVILGKTYPGFLDKYKQGHSIFFGDRIYTDMKCAKNANINNCLVLSGEATEKDYLANKNQIDYVINSVNDL